MEQSKDFLVREIQKLSLLLNTLLSKMNTIKPEEQDNTLDEINNSLDKEFGLSIGDFPALEQPELAIKLKNIDHTNVDKIARLVHLMAQNSENSKFEFLLSKPKTIDNIIFLVDYSAQQSSTFSFERMNLKAALQKEKK
jgi:hypothetical protein